MERYRKYQCATSLVGLKRVKAHFTASQSLVPLLWKRDNNERRSSIFLSGLCSNSFSTASNSFRRACLFFSITPAKLVQIERKTKFIALFFVVSKIMPIFAQQNTRLLMTNDEELLVKILKLSHEKVMAGKSFSQEEAERFLVLKRLE